MGSKSKRKKYLDDTSTDDSSLSSSSSSQDSERSSKRRRRHRSGDSSSRREKGRRTERREKRRDKRDIKTRKHKRKRASGGSLSGGDSESERSRVEPQAVLQDLLDEFPNVGNDLKQLLEMIDGGQAVDVKGIAERSLIKHLKKLFLSLKLKETDGVYLLPSNARPTLEVVGLMIQTALEHKYGQNEMDPEKMDEERRQVIDDKNITSPCMEDEDTGPKRRIIGPSMPSAELLAAAAKLTEAQAELREAEVEEDDQFFIGPAPPAVVAETESANEAERFEEVTRIMDSEDHSPYDVLGANQNMSADNIKKRYWKMSLLVHPDKCSHPQAHQAFVKLNKAFKELQDPDKRKVLDDKIKEKEEHERFKVELKAMREAAQWRKLQGISMEGDDELLADMEVKVAPKRDEWMTTLPPERKHGVTMQSTRFSKSTKGRGDTSAWTDTPSDRAQKAKMDYLDAYNEAAALASNEEEMKKKSSDADLVDKYNKEKRSKSLVQKHKEETASRSKRKSKQKPKEEWVGKHPWKPWDRETDLAGGRQSVKLDSENMTQVLSSRFSSGSYERNFL